MDDITSKIIKFIQDQPIEVRKKYIAYLNIHVNDTNDNWLNFYDTEFNFEDLRLFTSRITNIILDTVNVNNIVEKITQ
uniref:Uncharacterized protein n=1 Tax=viral metagenome TaxID=1070528 RepID=A0A6C0EPZ0_9ZZZZ